MSRFANREAKGRLSLGKCECPGSPHDEDWMELRTELGAEDAVAIETGGAFERLAVLVVGWNILDDSGEPAPVDREHLALLFADTFAGIEEWIDKHVRASTLPNRPAAPSRSSSEASGTRRTRTALKAV